MAPPSMSGNSIFAMVCKYFIRIAKVQISEQNAKGKKEK
jgi:hypothetical protein